MNNRLHEKYRVLEEQDTKRFLASELCLDKNWGASIWGVMLQIDLSEDVKTRIEEIQSDLRKFEGDNLLFVPRQAMHISVNQVIFWNGEYLKGKEQTWNIIKDDFIEKFISLDKTFSSFQIEFSKLVATESGILFCANDETDALQSIREQFKQKLPFPAETTKFNEIVHTTIARYNHSLQNPRAALHYLNKAQTSVGMTVQQINLKVELVFPSLKTEPIAHIQLQ